MESGKPKVVITGVSGWIGSWVAKYFLESGKYNVRGTVRDPSKSEKINPLLEGIGSSSSDLELVAADLLDAESIDKACEGMDYVIHVASPLLVEDPKDEEEVLGPAIKGTENVMKACSKHGIKRVVITSSWLCIIDWSKPGEDCDETQWTPITNDTPLYDKSKILAEKKAWEMAKESNIELVVICPGLVVGPTLYKSSFASAMLIGGLIIGKIPKWPQVYFPIVNVEDVAEAHVLALTAPAGERYALTEDTYKMIEVAKCLSAEFKKKNYKVTDSELPTCMAKFLACCCCVSMIKKFLKIWNRRCHVKNDKSLGTLGLKSYKPMKDSVISMGNSLIEHGMIPDKTKN